MNFGFFAAARGHGGRQQFPGTDRGRDGARDHKTLRRAQHQKVSGGSECRPIQPNRLFGQARQCFGREHNRKNFRHKGNLAEHDIGVVVHQPADRDEHGVGLRRRDRGDDIDQRECDGMPGNRQQCERAANGFLQFVHFFMSHIRGWRHDMLQHKRAVQRVTCENAGNAHQREIKKGQRKGHAPQHGRIQKRRCETR